MSDLYMARSTATIARTTAQSRVGRRGSRALGVAAAIAAALILWLIAHPLLGVDMKITLSGGTQTMHIGWLSVLIFSGASSLVAWGLVAMLERFTPDARAIWTKIAAVTLLLSFAGPLFGAGSANAGTKGALILMHLAVAAVLIPVLASTSPTPHDPHAENRQATAVDERSPHAGVQ